MTPSGSYYVLQATSGLGRRLDVDTSSGTGWRALSAPPMGTSAVAFGATGVITAFVVDDTILTIWRWSPSTSHWNTVQVINVPIEFGSSQ
jgi:hypothetical protein